MIEPAIMAALTADLQRDEGLRLKPYRDTVGKLTIGYGRNLDDVGISRAEALALLENDLDGWVVPEMRRRMPWLAAAPANVQRAVANMLFNLGWTRLSKFTATLAALQAGDYATAAREALDSQWAKQVGKRAERIANLIRGT